MRAEQKDFSDHDFSYLNMRKKKKFITYAIQMWDLHMRTKMKIYARREWMSDKHYGNYQILECMHVDEFITHYDSSKQATGSVAILQK